MSYVRRPNTPQRSHRSPAKLLCRLALGATLLVPLWACENDSYMNPSIVGRWEDTPTLVPILDRLAVVEGTNNPDFGEFSEITQADLIPEVDPYRIDAGDGVQVFVNELFNPNQLETYERVVDRRGHIDLPNIPAVFIAGKTTDEAAAAIAAAYKARGVLNEPVVSITVPAQRRQTFNLIGGVNSPGTYSIPRPEFRLLEAISQGGRFSEYVQWVYVIRGVPLTDRAAGRYAETTTPTQGVNGSTPGAGPAVNLPNDPNAQPGQGKPGEVKKESVLDLIESLGGPEVQPAPAPAPTPTPAPAPAPSPTPGIAPGMMQPAPDAPVPARPPVIDLEAIANPEGKPAAKPPQPTPAPTPTTAPTEPEAGTQATPASPPAIELPPTLGRTDSPARPPTPAPQSAATPSPRWVFVDGQWVPAGAASSRGNKPGKAGTPNPATDVLSQRVIRIPMSALLGGSAMYNIVIRPGDVVRVPSPMEGLVYVAGQVARPGPYSLPAVGKPLTLIRAIDSAGGLSDTAIPERVDITRFVGPDRQATVRLNFRAIAEGTQPDLYMREGDRINVGTNFWALPLAVVRNGFRASYGFGFILDRNFGYEIFGPQDTGSIR